MMSSYFHVGDETAFSRTSSANPWLKVKKRHPCHPHILVGNIMRKNLIG